MAAAPVVWFCRVSYAKKPHALAVRHWREEQARRLSVDRLEAVANLAPMPPVPGAADAERLAYTQRVQPALKRLRIALARAGGAEPDGSVLMRYYVVAEHGDRHGRLHHHVLLCFDGQASAVVRKRHLEAAFAAMRSNGSARYRQRVAALAFGDGRSKPLPPKDKAPMLRAAYGGQCRFTKLGGDVASKVRVARYVSVYAAKTIAGEAGRSYRVRASERWGYVGADRVVTDAMIAVAQEYDYTSVRLGGVNIPRRLYAVRWNAHQSERIKVMCKALFTSSPLGNAVANQMEATKRHDWRSGYGPAQAALPQEDRAAVIAYAVVSGHLSLLERPATFRVFGEALLRDGRNLIARLSEVTSEETAVGPRWVLPDGLTVGAWHRSQTGVLTREEWAQAGFL